MLQLRAVEGASGELLQTLLQERNLIGTPVTGVVSYGVKEQYLHTEPGLPVLNQNAGKYDKVQAFEKMAALGVSVPKWSLNPDDLTLPIFGRRKKHTKGKDIVPLLAKDQTYEFLKRPGVCDFFVQFIPTEVEYRVWVYRRQVLATYKKFFIHEAENPTRGFAFNHGFEFLENPPRELEEPAAKAVHALELDFGAVDIIKGQDGNLYVLEVNTAPWAHTRLRGLVRLANKIQRWSELGMPRRRENF